MPTEISYTEGEDSPFMRERNDAYPRVYPLSVLSSQTAANRVGQRAGFALFLWKKGKIRLFVRDLQ